MKKIIILSAVLALLASSCSNEETSNDNQILAPVRVHVNDFSVSMDEFPESQTRATDIANYNDVKAITLAFYNGTTEEYKTTQLRSSATSFGEFTLSLPMGSYTMVVVGYALLDGDEFTLTSPTSASFSPKARETFVNTQTVNITNAAAVDISATLERIVSRLKVDSTDGRTANATSVRMTLSAGGKSFNPSTGAATVNTGFTNTLNISAAVGNTTSSTSFLFLASDEQDINVTIETLDADGNPLFSKTVENVPLKRNRITTLSGTMYTNPSVGGAFQVNTDWLTGNNVPF